MLKSIYEHFKHSPSSINDHQKMEIIKVFDMIDDDKMGTITEAKLTKFLKTIGIHDPKPQDVMGMINFFDKDKDGKVHY